MKKAFAITAVVGAAAGLGLVAWWLVTRRKAATSDGQVAQNGGGVGPTTSRVTPTVALPTLVNTATVPSTPALGAVAQTLAPPAVTTGTTTSGGGPRTAAEAYGMVLWPGVRTTRVRVSTPSGAVLFDRTQSMNFQEFRELLMQFGIQSDWRVAVPSTGVLPNGNILETF